MGRGLEGTGGGAGGSRLSSWLHIRHVPAGKVSLCEFFADLAAETRFISLRLIGILITLVGAQKAGARMCVFMHVNKDKR